MNALKLQSYKEANWDGKKVELYKYFELNCKEYRLQKINKDFYSVDVYLDGKDLVSGGGSFTTGHKIVGGATAREKALVFIQEIWNNAQ